MNKRVLRAMIAMLWSFLIAFAIIKMFFAEWFIAAIDNDKIIMIGSLIDESRFLTILADSLIGTLAIHFYLCSCKSVWRLHIFEYICIFLYSLAVSTIQPHFPDLIFYVDGALFVVVPILMGVNWKRVALVFLAHDVGQMLILFIRSQEMYLEGADYVTSLILVFDVYVWLLLYYLYANMYKEVNKNGNSRNSLLRRQKQRRASEGACKHRKEDGKA